MLMSLPNLAYPGLLLGPSSKYTPGPGTHIYESQIYASLSGRPVIVPSPPTTTSSSKSQALPTISVPNPTDLTSPSANLNTLPAVNSVVIGKITRIQSRQVGLEILVVDGNVCRDYSWQGVVRKEDVRGWEIDKVVLGEAFRVGDLARGVVISLGDQSNFYISTARNELGVMMATSEDGNTMVPISWKEYRDPVTGRTESRKVAKPI
ncbi:exosome 3'-_5 exonuclease subunit ski4 (Csl4) [Agyrium rufum]|nr:exosome 3'->5 exonuclease subunit ski4 (Csl4) [Agyrium rufum]